MSRRLHCPDSPSERRFRLTEDSGEPGTEAFVHSIFPSRMVCRERIEPRGPNALPRAALGDRVVFIDTTRSHKGVGVTIKLNEALRAFESSYILPLLPGLENFRRLNQYEILGAEQIAQPATRTGSA